MEIRHKIINPDCVPEIMLAIDKEVATISEVKDSFITVTFDDDLPKELVYSIACLIVSIDCTSTIEKLEAKLNEIKSKL